MHLDRRRLQRLIEALDRPLLGLAAVSMVFYLLDLHGLIDDYPGLAATVNVGIDAIFIVDLIAKIFAYHTDYLRTPWFLIDLLSCLPVLDTISAGLVPLRSIRFIRGFRVLRIFRGMRLLRAVRGVPAFEELLRDPHGLVHAQRFHRAMNIGLVVLTLVLMTALLVVRNRIEHSFREGVDLIARQPLSSPQLAALGIKAQRAQALGQGVRLVPPGQRFREPVDLLGRHAERAADVAQRRA